MHKDWRSYQPIVKVIIFHHFRKAYCTAINVVAVT